ncbi:MAG: cell division protein FtsA [Nitrospira sp.]|nr:cell division protein FtsA [bacterium]MBL7048201.1 cell division protein FtsA [Nitrospira sp.]
MPFGFIKDISLKGSCLVAGLDIGSTKVCAVIGEVIYPERGWQGNPGSAKAGAINVIGSGTVVSNGIKKGVITNMEGIVEAVREAVREAERSAGAVVKNINAGITGGHIGCLASHGVIAIKDREIKAREIESVLEAARAVAIPFDREILHVIPVDYTVDGQRGISNPRGMIGIRLETDVQIITGAAGIVKTLARSCQKAGIEISEIVLNPLASADALLTTDEKERGVAVFDIGGGTTDMAMFRDGALCHSGVITLGGSNFTNDIAIGLRIPSNEAEAVKIKYGCTMLSHADAGGTAEIGPAANSRSIPRSYIAEILQPRAEELLQLLREQLISANLHKDMNAGIVLTGGGALMKGMDAMAENILELPVRIGSPGQDGLLDEKLCNPEFSTCIGLMGYGTREHLRGFSADGRGMMQNIRVRISDLARIFRH